MNVIYKILFEVRLLHEFYLTKGDGTSIFSGASVTDRTTFLQDFFDRGQRSINSDIEYAIPPRFRNFRLKLLKTYSGFKVATEVTQTTDGSNIAWQPVAPMPPDLGIPIMLLRTNADFDTYTNRRLSIPFDSIYYFSNGSASGTKSFPFLTNTIPARSSSGDYEQGELSQNGGTIGAFYIDSNGARQFASVTGKNFTSEADRNLVYPTFNYYFKSTDKVKTANITITDKGGTSVYTRKVTSATPIDTITISVDPAKITTIPATITEDNLAYTLTITGTSGYKKTFRIFFLENSLRPSAALGLINIINQPDDPAFSLLNTKRLLASPVFEIWIKSRFSFWRYSNDQGLQLKNSYPTALNAAGNNLVSIIPQNHTYTPIPVGDQKLPNPKLFSPVKPEGQQLFADIIVPASDVFPLGP